MKSSVTTKETTNIEALPDELLAPILRLTGQSTCARVSRHCLINGLDIPLNNPPRTPQ